MPKDMRVFLESYEKAHPEDVIRIKETGEYCLGMYGYCPPF